MAIDDFVVGFQIGPKSTIKFGRLGIQIVDHLIPDTNRLSLLNGWGNSTRIDSRNNICNLLLKSLFTKYFLSSENLVALIIFLGPVLLNLRA